MEGKLQVWAGAKELDATEQMGHMWNLKIKGREKTLEGEAMDNKSVFKRKNM